MRRALIAYNQEDQPQEADEEVGGDSENTDWDEPSSQWMDQKNGAVRRALARLRNGLKRAASEVDLVAAVRNGELLGAVDARKHGADDLRYWRLKIEPPFELHRLSAVPLRLAVPFTDIGTRSARLQSAKQGWRMARPFAAGRPFKQLR